MTQEPQFSFEISDEKQAFDIPEEAFTGKKSAREGAEKPIVDPNAVKEGTGEEGQKLDLEKKDKEEPIDINSAFVKEAEPKDDRSKEKDDNTEDQEDVKDPLDVFYNAFVERGLLDKDENYEKSEDKEEAFVDLFNKREEKTKESIYKQIASELGDEGTALIRHLRNGGAIEDFAQVYSDPLKNVDITKPEHQKAVIRQYYQNQGWDELDVDQEVKDIEDLGEEKMADKAKKMFTKLQTAQEEERADFEKAQEAQETQRKQTQTTFINSINDVLEKKDELFGISLGKDPRVKQELKDYILKPKVRLDDGRIVSQFIADRVKNQNNMEMYVLNAYLAKNGYKFEDIKKAATTKATLGIKKQLEQSRKQPTMTTKGSSEASEESEVAKARPSLDWTKLFG